MLSLIDYCLIKEVDMETDDYGYYSCPIWMEAEISNKNGKVDVLCELV